MTNKRMTVGELLASLRKQHASGSKDPGLLALIAQLERMHPDTIANVFRGGKDTISQVIGRAK